MDASTDILDQAIKFATDAHAGARRKGSRVPYILHPLEAAAIVATLTGDCELMAAAVLHDTMEDAHVTFEQLEQLFGSRIAELVTSESENKRRELPASETWHIRKQETLDSLARAGIDVKIIALGDKLSNLRAFARDYHVMGEEMWLRFNQRDRAEHEWYYRGVASRLTELSDTDAYREYLWQLERVFGRAAI